MLTALILVCALSAPECTPAVNIDVMVLPGLFAVCPGMIGQATLAGTQIGRDMGPDELMRVVCLRVRP